MRIEARKYRLGTIKAEKGAVPDCLITLIVSPEDANKWGFLNHPTGERYFLDVVEADEEEYSAEYSEVEFKKPFRELPLSQQAALLCKKEDFFQYIEWQWGVAHTEEKAIETLKWFCGITSRSELTTNTEAADKYRELIKKFEFWQVENRYKENLQRI